MAWATQGKVRKNIRINFITSLPLSVYPATPELLKLTLAFQPLGRPIMAIIFLNSLTILPLLERCPAHKKPVPNLPVTNQSNDVQRHGQSHNNVLTVSSADDLNLSSFKPKPDKGVYCLFLWRRIGKKIFVKQFSLIKLTYGEWTISGKGFGGQKARKHCSF